ncbi:RNA polymerase sigma factor [Roseivirga sp.]|uniref:RNA polymerase sigma factor n=1 Tax=Roseivirga sp. TaxID=1964215 RepID=UPI003B8DB94B
MSNSKQTDFMTAYNGCHDRFLRYCSSLAYGKMDVQDLVQDVLLTAYHNYEKIEKKEQLLHYLIRAARNRSISLWRKQKNQQELTEIHAERLADQGVSPETILDIQVLYRMLNKLPLKQKDALILFEINGFSMKEIAEIQHSNEGAVKTKISRGRKKLTALMSDKTSSPVSDLLETIQTITL